jgi:hypothetical protein
MIRYKDRDGKELPSSLERDGRLWHELYCPRCDVTFWHHKFPLCCNCKRPLDTKGFTVVTWFADRIILEEPYEIHNLQTT